MKKIIVLAILFALMHPFRLMAQSSFAGGSGTAADPYMVSTPAQLYSVRNYLTSVFALANDIDLNVAPYNTGEGWLPLGDAGSPFNGTFHGRGHAIRNLYIKRPTSAHVGLFGSVTNPGVIDSLGVMGCKVTGRYYVGGLVGSSYGNITNCYSSGSVSSGDNSMVGGLAGISAATITNCYSSCSVSSGVYSEAGGLVGWLAIGAITNCYSSGSVSSGDNSPTGGLVGYADGTITNCYNSGSVSSGDISYVGGLVGSSANCTITYCYSSGSVSSGDNSYVGGLAGYVPSTIMYCYYDKNTSGQSSGSYGSSTGITGLTTARMKQQASFSGWDFTSANPVWGITENKTYPALKGVNNAPFAFRDTLKGITTIALTGVLANDYDYETGQANLVYQVLQVYRGGTVNTDIYSFPVSTGGFTDSLRYRVGELLSPGDTLWGNEAKAVLTIPVILSATPGTIQLRAANNSSSSVAVTTNTDWSAISSESWLTPGSTSGTGNSNLTVSATENNTGSARTATVTLSATGATNVIITVTQDAKQLLTIGLTAQNKVYDGNTDAVVTASITSGLIAGDVVTAIASNGKFDNASVGSSKVVTADIGISGADAVNYTCSATAVTTASILDNTAPVVTFPTLSGNTPIHTDNSIEISFSEPVTMVATSLEDALIIREGDVNGSEIAYTPTGFTNSDLTQFSITADLKCGTTYYIAVKAGTFTDSSGNAIALAEQTFSTVADINKPVFTNISSMLCPNSYIEIANYDNSLQYQWQLNGTDLTNQTGNQYKLPSDGAGDYTVVVLNTATGCQTASDALPVQLYNVVTPVVYEKNDQNLLSLLIVDNSAKMYTGYLWTMADGSALPSETINNRQFLTHTGTGINEKYMVETTDVNGCKAQSEAVTIKANLASMVVYPTVNSGNFRIDMKHPDNGTIVVKVINQLGTTVQQYRFTKTSQRQSFEINMGAVAGKYLVEACIEGYRDAKWIVVE